MKKLLIVILTAITGVIAIAQKPLLIEGQTFINTDNHWSGVWITRDEPMAVVFRNNMIQCINESGYLLNCGSDSPQPESGNLNGTVVYGNYLDWNGTEPAALTHGMMCGYNINYVLKYNFYDNVPYAVVIKSGQDGNNLVNTAGGYAYNIFKNSKNSIICKGINNVSIYNNTFYRTNWNPIVITNNTDLGIGSPCQNIKIKNNIFYTRGGVAAIRVFDEASVSTLECDYNVYYCEGGDHNPTFMVRSTTYTLAQWRALGFDTHSVVVNPNFIDTLGFVPTSRLEYGTDLGFTWLEGLSENAVWGTTTPETTPQGSVWQAGARIYSSTIIPVYVSSSVDEDNPTVVEMLYNMNLAGAAPAATAFTVMVNSNPVPVTAVAMTGNIVQLTLENRVYFGDIVTVTYNKPASNPLQNADGGEAVSITDRPVNNTTETPSGALVAVKVYPVPAQDNLTVRILDAELVLDEVRVINKAGTTVMVFKADQSLRQFDIPVKLPSGSYVVQCISGINTCHTQRIVIVKPK